MTWAAWSGQGMNSFKTAANGFGLPANQYSGTGAVLALDMLDIGLESLDAPGKLAQLMLQMNVAVKNVSKATITPTLYVIAVSQGIFSVFEKLIEHNNDKIISLLKRHIQIAGISLII